MMKPEKDRKTKIIGAPALHKGPAQSEIRRTLCPANGNFYWILL